MKLFTKATSQMAYFKGGFYGRQGSGKTFTASLVAEGLVKLSGSKKPVLFYDTETGSDFVVDHFQEAGIELYHFKSRSFESLVKAMDEAEQEGSVIIIDSITHVWLELQEAYRRRTGRKRIEFQDWAEIKSMWRNFTDRFVNGKVHAIVCGRAGYEYEYDIDDETKRKELIKGNMKMKAEGELGYEPSFLVEMEEFRTVPRGARRVKKGEIIIRAHVVKDRTRTMNGVVINNPKFEDFAPAIQKLNLGGEHFGVDTTRRSDGVFDSPENNYRRKRQVEITLEEIKEAFVLAELDGTSTEAKRKRTLLLREVFGTSAWTAIESMKLEALETGVEQLRVKLGQKSDDVFDGDDLPESYGGSTPNSKPVEAEKTEAAE
jgi:hypothetical protein